MAGTNGSAPTLRAGLIGLGMMGRHHARVLRSLDGVELVAVADPLGDPHKVAGGLDLHRSVEEILAVGLDYCVVAVPTAYHEEIGLALAEAGVHALIEKPLAPDGEGARRLAETFESPRAGRRCRAHRAVQPGAAARCGAGSSRASSATSTRSSRGGRARSRPASPTSASSRTSPRTTSTSPPG